MSSNAVLVVDPSPSVAVLAAAPVMAAGCECKVVATVAEAMRLAPQLMPKLMLVDAQLPPPTREQVTQVLRSREREVPLVIMASPTTQAEHIEAWGNAGADDCVLKPLRLV